MFQLRGGLCPRGGEGGGSICIVTAGDLSKDGSMELILYKADETTMRVSINRYKEEESSWV